MFSDKSLAKFHSKTCYNILKTFTTTISPIKSCALIVLTGTNDNQLLLSRYNEKITCRTHCNTISQVIIACDNEHCERNNFLFIQKHLSACLSKTAVEIVKTVKRTQNFNDTALSRSQLKGGGDDQYVAPEITIPTVIEEDKKSKTIHVQILFPESQKLKCEMCAKASLNRLYSNTVSLQTGAKDSLKKHFMKIHGFTNVMFSMKCAICGAESPTGKDVVKWSHAHMARIHTNYTKKKTLVAKEGIQCDNCNVKFPNVRSLASHKNSCGKSDKSKGILSQKVVNRTIAQAFFPNRKSSPAVPPKKEKTPTKAEINDLESKIQTRSTAKTVSAMKEQRLQSVEKKLTTGRVPPRRLTMIVESNKNDNNSPIRKLLFNTSPDTRRQTITTRCASPTARPSSATPTTTKRKIDATCLTYDSGKDSWLGGDIIWEFFKRHIQSECSGIIDPLVWQDEFMVIPNKPKVYLPICHEEHWVLLELYTDNLIAVYYDSKHGRPPAEITAKMEEKGYVVIESIRDMRGPYQTDGDTCGIHVCLVAEKRAKGRHPRFSDQDIADFRFCLLDELERDPSIQVIIQPNDNNNATPNKDSSVLDLTFNIQDLADTKNDNEDEQDIFVFDVPMSSNSITIHDHTSSNNDDTIAIHTPIVHQQLTIAPISTKTAMVDMACQTDDMPATKDQCSSDSQTTSCASNTISTQTQLSAVECLLYKNSRRTNEVVEKPKPPTTDRDKIPKLLLQQISKPKGYKPIKLTTDTAAIKAKILKWLNDQVNSYNREDRKFCRLEWIAGQYASLLNSFASGNIEITNKTLATIPPPDRDEGDIAIQARRPRDVRPSKYNDITGCNVKKLYKQNRQKAFSLILGEAHIKCQAPIDKVEDHFKACSKKPAINMNDLDEISKDIPQAGIPSHFYNDFTTEEIRKVLKNAKDTAPGGDKVRYKYILDLDSLLTISQFLYNECKRHKRIPEEWKSANTTLIFKKGDMDDISNWRPIALMSCLYKLYSSLWNNRLKQVRRLISKVQKGFSSRDGCAEHIAVMRTAIDNARSEKQDLSIAFLDLTNAFGSVPHELIQHSLAKFGFKEEFMDIITDIYKDSKSIILTEHEQTAPIVMRAGTKQGDPISTTLFNISMEYLIRYHTTRSKGAKVLGAHLKLLAFADDLALFADSANQLQLELDGLMKAAKSLNLNFNAKKCAVLMLKNGNPCTAYPITLDDKRLEALGENDTYKYLGVQMGNGAKCNIDDLLVQLGTEMNKVAESKLAPWQKLDAIKCFILPKLTYMGMNATPNLQSMTKFDSMTMAMIKEIHGIPNMGGPREYVQLQPQHGGLGVLSPKTQMLLNCAVAAVRRLWNNDKFTSEYHWNHLLAVGSRLKKATATKEEAIGYLNFENPGLKTGSKYNSYSRVREAVRYFTELKGAPFHMFKFEMINGELAIKLQVSPDDPTVTIEKNNYSQVTNIIKRFLQKSLLKSLTSKNKVGRVTEVVANDPRNNRFVKDGGMLSYASHSFIHKARTDTTLLLASGVEKTACKNCRRCGEAVPETLTHVLQTCKVHLGGLITDRHNAVLQRIVQGTRLGTRKKCKIYIDEKSQTGSRQRPDLMLIDEDRREVVISDVTCPMENGLKAMQAAEAKKIDKYRDIAKSYEDRGYSVSQLPIVVGSLGSWYKPNDAAVRALGINRDHAKTMIEIIQATVIEHSKNIYYKHMYGDQYKILPKYLPCLPFRGAKWTKVDLHANHDQDPASRDPQTNDSYGQTPVSQDTQTNDSYGHGPANQDTTTHDNYGQAPASQDSDTYDNYLFTSDDVIYQ
jgi:hypothetical protein